MNTKAIVIIKVSDCAKSDVFMLLIFNDIFGGHNLIFQLRQKFTNQMSNKAEILGIMLSRTVLFGVFG